MDYIAEIKVRGIKTILVKNCKSKRDAQHKINAYYEYGDCQDDIKGLDTDLYADYHRKVYITEDHSFKKRKEQS